MADTDSINCRYFVSPVFVFIGAALITIGVVTNHWTTSSAFDSSITYGLWKFCRNNGQCDPIDPRFVTSELLACRGFLVFGPVACAISIIMILVYPCFPRRGDSENKLFPILSAGFGVVAGVSCLAGVAVWASVKDFIPIGDTSLGFSFILGAMSGFMLFFGSLVGFGNIFRNRCGFRRRYTIIVDEF
ncbi:lens fiber membrane intrinsic protein-like [Physella acuta]|uniref:lens fiber membrane intrinsic protein-like n=1 Tax=Physella acuta TaxID=109671 RepID=UPI0027DEA84E|nr:lens fiber membrane intrinsic protein-like [Physella acuta]